MRKSFVNVVLVHEFCFVQGNNTTKKGKEILSFMRLTGTITHANNVFIFYCLHYLWLFLVLGKENTDGILG